MNIVEARELLLLIQRDLGERSARIQALGDEAHRKFCVYMPTANWHCWTFSDYERWWEANMQKGVARASGR